MEEAGALNESLLQADLHFDGTNVHRCSHACAHTHGALAKCSVSVTSNLLLLANAFKQPGLQQPRMSELAAAGVCEGVDP
jgi:hypothetical protein